MFYSEAYFIYVFSALTLITSTTFLYYTTTIFTLHTYAVYLKFGNTLHRKKGICFTRQLPLQSSSSDQEGKNEER